MSTHCYSGESTQVSAFYNREVQGAWPQETESWSKRRIWKNLSNFCVFWSFAGTWASQGKTTLSLLYCAATEQLFTEHEHCLPWTLGAKISCLGRDGESLVERRRWHFHLSSIPAGSQVSRMGQVWVPLSSVFSTRQCGMVLVPPSEGRNQVWWNKECIGKW